MNGLALSLAGISLRVRVFKLSLLIVLLSLIIQPVATVATVATVDSIPVIPQPQLKNLVSVLGLKQD